MVELRDHFRKLALYNRWANRQLYRVAAECSCEDLASDRGAYFHSVLGTLNHLLVTDKMWRARLQGNSPRGVQLDEVLFTDLQKLAEARNAEDDHLIEVVYGFSDHQLGNVFHYSTSSALRQSQPLYEVLAHVFNHQTHHRGQAHDLLGQILGAARTPVLDLLYYQRTAAPTDVPSEGSSP